MKPLPSESRFTHSADALSKPTDQGRLGLLLSCDLIFTTKVKQTAAALGYSVLVASNTSLARSLIEKSRPRVVFVDLTAGEMVSPIALSTYLELAGADAWFLAFGPHVEADVLAAAKAAGCQVVLPRSKFAADLPELMRRYFSEEPGEPG